MAKIIKTKIGDFILTDTELIHPDGTTMFGEYYVKGGRTPNGGVGASTIKVFVSGWVSLQEWYCSNYRVFNEKKEEILKDKNILKVEEIDDKIICSYKGIVNEEFNT